MKTDEEIRQAAIDFAAREVLYSNREEVIEAIAWYLETNPYLTATTCDGCDENRVAVVAAFEAGATWVMEHFPSIE